MKMRDVIISEVDELLRLNDDFTGTMNDFNDGFMQGVKYVLANIEENGVMLDSGKVLTLEEIKMQGYNEKFLQKCMLVLLKPDNPYYKLPKIEDVIRVGKNYFLYETNFSKEFINFFFNNYECEKTNTDTIHNNV